MAGRGDESSISGSIERLLQLIADQLRDSTGLRYLLTGGVLFLLDLGIYVALHLGLGVAVMASQLISRSTGAAAGFIGHKYFSFGANGDRQAMRATSQGLAYVLIMGANILVSPLLVAFMVSLLDGRAVVGKLISDAIIIAETYLLLRLIFRADARRIG